VSGYRPALRVPRARARNQPGGHVTRQVLISERPAEAEDRVVPGHWEGDLIIGLNRSAIGTVVERSTRFTMLLHLPRMPGYGSGPRVNNGPALAGYGAQAMRDVLASRFVSMPEQLRRSLTWDRARNSPSSRLPPVWPIYFADPHSPWQRGTNENTNGLLRQYFPKGTDLSRWSREEIEAIAGALNARPRKTLSWKTPPKPSTSSYCYSNKAVLPRPLEPGQYTSWAFTQRAKDSGLLPSMGTIGDAYDNAVIESFWARMQTELLDRRGWNTRVELANAIFEYLEIFHNRQRRHSALGWRTPVEFEKLHATDVA
jgi:transposase, IS30 family